MKHKKSLIVGFITIIIAVIVGISIFITQGKSSEYKVYALLPLTGPAASYGQHMKAGILLAQQNEINCVVEFFDSKGSPTESVSIVNSVLARKSTGKIGFIVALSSVSSAVAPILDANNIPTVLTCVATPSIYPNTENFNQLFWTTDDFIPVVAHEIDKNSSTVAVIVLNDDYGLACANTIRRVIDPNKIVTSETFAMVGGENNTLVSKIIQSNPNAVFIAGFGPNYIDIIKQIRMRFPQVAIYSSMDLGNPQVRQSLDVAANGIVFPALLPDLNEDLTETIIVLRDAATDMLQEPVYIALCFYAHDALIRVKNAMLGEKIDVASNNEIIASLNNGGLALGVIDAVPKLLIQRDDKPTK